MSHQRVLDFWNQLRCSRSHHWAQLQSLKMNWTQKYFHLWVEVHPTLAFHLTLTHPHYQNLKFSRILAILTKICLQNCNFFEIAHKLTVHYPWKCIIITSSHVSRQSQDKTSTYQNDFLHFIYFQSSKTFKLCKFLARDPRAEKLVHHAIRWTPDSGSLNWRRIYIGNSIRYWTNTRTHDQ